MSGLQPNNTLLPPQPVRSFNGPLAKSDACVIKFDRGSLQTGKVRNMVWQWRVEKVQEGVDTKTVKNA